MRLTPVALAALLVLGLGACRSGEPTSSDHDDREAESAIIQPGRPGEANETLDPDATVEQPGTDDADVAFVQMMIPHHAQALEMSRLARNRARDDQVLAIARRIQGAQRPEIVAMAGWLESRGLDVPESMADAMGGHGSHHGHGDTDVRAMRGMLTAREMTELARARGAAFDRLFLAGMIRHHEGAVAMARDEMEAGSDTLALELAADVAAGQQAEIGRMVAIRRRL